MTMIAGVMALAATLAVNAYSSLIGG